MKTVLDNIKERSASNVCGKFDGTIIFLVDKDTYTFIGSDFGPVVHKCDCRRCECESDLGAIFSDRGNYLSTGMYKLDCTLWLKKNNLEAHLIKRNVEQLM